MKTLAEIFEHTLEDVFYAENANHQGPAKGCQGGQGCQNSKKPLRIILEETKG